MDSFRWIAVALSMILGLGVTRLLSAMVAVFRSRHRVRLDWIPLAWAGCIFMWQLQYWWAVIELPSLIHVWTLPKFLTLIFLTLLLFVAAALVLPPDELKERDSLWDSFERDGRWALVALSLYFMLALFADWKLWDISPISTPGELLATLALLPLLYVMGRRRWLEVIITLSYIPLSIWAILVLSPASY